MTFLHRYLAARTAERERQLLPLQERRVRESLDYFRKGYSPRRRPVSRG